MKVDCTKRRCYEISIQTSECLPNNSETNNLGSHLDLLKHSFELSSQTRLGLSPMHYSTLEVPIRMTIRSRHRENTSQPCRRFPESLTTQLKSVVSSQEHLNFVPTRELKTLLSSGTTYSDVVDEFLDCKCRTINCAH
jgi:hypothetical protein